MPKRFYEAHNFRPESAATIDRANAILNEYRDQGYVLTLRQLYYQFVARGLIPNSDRSYKNLGQTISDGRMAGLIDWDAIEDRTRNLRAHLTYADPADWIRYAARASRYPLWDRQPNYVEVWVEKDALVGVVERAASPLYVPFFSCRGYTSQSEMWGASQRLWRNLTAGKNVTILHFGDHDPSGRDMTRDIRDRLATFVGIDEYRRQTALIAKDDDPEDATRLAEMSAALDRLTVDRMALNWDQIEQYDPPPNPAKVTDSRARDYIAEFGTNSWELDALEPQVIADLIDGRVRDLIDPDLWNEDLAIERAAGQAIAAVGDRWAEVVEALGIGGNGDGR